MGGGKETAGIDRRKYIRYACKTELKAIVDFNPSAADRTTGKLQPIVFHKGETAEVVNISEKGISLEMDHFLPKGMTMKMAIDNPIAPPIQTGGRIMWVKKIRGTKNRCVMGLAFRYMREKHRRNLDKLIEFLRTIPK
jgi:hypothetical protein